MPHSYKCKTTKIWLLLLDLSLGGFLAICMIISIFSSHHNIQIPNDVIKENMWSKVMVGHEDLTSILVGHGWSQRPVSMLNSSWLVNKDLHPCSLIPSVGLYFWIFSFTCWYTKVMPFTNSSTRNDFFLVFIIGVGRRWSWMISLGALLVEEWVLLVEAKIQ